MGKKRDFKFWPKLEKWGRNSVLIHLFWDLAPRTQFRNLYVYFYKSTWKSNHLYITSVGKHTLQINNFLKYDVHIEPVHKLEMSFIILLCSYVFTYSDGQLKALLSYFCPKMQLCVTCDICLKFRIFSNRNNIFTWSVGFWSIIPYLQLPSPPLWGL